MPVLSLDLHAIHHQRVGPSDAAAGGRDRDAGSVLKSERCIRGTSFSFSSTYATVMNPVVYFGRDTYLRSREHLVKKKTETKRFSNMNPIVVVM